VFTFKRYIFVWIQITITKRLCYNKSEWAYCKFAQKRIQSVYPIYPTCH